MTFAMKLKDERQAGREEGRLESQIKMIKHMIGRGLSVDTIADFLDLSVDEVMTLSEIHNS